METFVECDALDTTSDVWYNTPRTVITKATLWIGVKKDLAKRN